MSVNLDNVDRAFSVAVYKKLKNQIQTHSEKLNEVREAAQLIETTPGPKGDKGIQGNAGIQGPKGDKGIQGNAGIQGPKGDKGIQGNAGIQGPKGKDGKQGPLGLRGDVGTKGDTGDVGPKGDVGIQGPKGDKGIQGNAGIQGIMGLDGDVGPKGDVGIQGPKGEDGIQGPKGDVGPKGDTGIQGLKGEDGIQGLKGEDGIQGLKGEDGKDAELPDIDKIIEPLFNKAKDELDSFVIKSDKDFKNWKSVVNNQLSTIGGGGAVKISQLVDVQQSTAKVDGQFLKYDASQKKWVGGAVDLNSIIGAAPETLDTLVELASAINNDDNFATTIADNIATKASQTDLDTHTGDTDNPHSVTATQVGLGNVTNESKAVMFTDPTFTGNVGIGTSSPDELLHLEATSQSSTREVLMKATVSDAGNDQFGIGNGTSTNSNFAPSFYGYKDSNYGNGYIYSMNFRGLVPSSQDTTQTNRFGIIHFEAYKTSSATDPNNSLVGGVSNRKVLTVANGQDTLVNIGANGNVGIGTENPAGKLHIVGSGIYIEPRVENTAVGAAGFAFINSNQEWKMGVNVFDTFRIRDHNAGTNVFQIESGAPADSFVIDSNGNVGIGTTTPSEKLEVNGNGTFSGTLNVDQDTTLNSTTVGKITLSDNSFVTETSSFTLGETHRGATVLLQNTSPITITVPSQVAGHTTTFIAETSNAVVFASGTGLTAFNSFNAANQIAGIFGQAQIIFKSSTEAFLGGNVV